jgi:hypothetical protein
VGSLAKVRSTRYECFVPESHGRGIAAQGFGIRARFMSFFHDALSLGALNSGELRMQLYRKTVAALVILDQAHQGPHCGILWNP